MYWVYKPIAVLPMNGWFIHNYTKVNINFFLLYCTWCSYLCGCTKFMVSQCINQYICMRYHWQLHVIRLCDNAWNKLSTKVSLDCCCLNAEGVETTDKVLVQWTTEWQWQLPTMHMSPCVCTVVSQSVDPWQAYSRNTQTSHHARSEKSPSLTWVLHEIWTPTSPVLPSHICYARNTCEGNIGMCMQESGLEIHIYIFIVWKFVCNVYTRDTQ